MMHSLEPTLAPYEYEVLWRLAADGPLTGGEIATSAFVRRYGWSPMVAGGKLARIARRTGFVERIDGIWHLTPAGKRWLAP